MKNKRMELQNVYPELIDFGINWFGYYSNKTTTEKLAKHHHGSCYEICYLESGIQPYYVYPSENTEENAQMYRLHGGEIFITHPYEYHSSGSFQQLRGRLYWIQLNSECPELFKHTAEKSDMLKEALAGVNRHILRVPKSITTRLTEAFELTRVMDKERIFRACELLSLFILELADFNRKIIDESNGLGKLSPKAVEAVTFIQNNLLNAALNLDTVAEHLHYSRSYTMGFFRNEIGLTIHEYILRCKIECACELLQKHSITETALLLNFSSSQHFSRVFKEYTSMTPREYAKQLILDRGSEPPIFNDFL